MSAGPSLLRLTRTAVLVAILGILASAVSGCGGTATDEPSEEVVSLYVLDHDGANPTEHVIAPYVKAFLDLQQVCEGTEDELANSTLKTATDATNGSGREVTSLEVMRAVAKAAGTTRQDCSGVFVGVEARLEGAALKR